MLNAVKNFVRNEEGLETVEYAVMTALIIGTLVTGIGFLAAAVENRFKDVETIINKIDE